MSKFFHYFIIFIVIFLVAAVILYPHETVAAAYNGLFVWATLVIPALLPFFIGSEILISLGVVRFLGVLLEPIMRPIFNVPGEGSFAFAMSITSGYPVGATIVSKLRSDNVLSGVEGQRLISFCSTSGPLFMIGSVAVGMFQSSKLGIFIVIAHYIGAILVGILFSFYKRSSFERKSMKVEKNLFKKALRQLSRKDSSNLSLGLILGNAVKSSLNTILMVGGFIVLFAVVIRMFEITNILYALSRIIGIVLLPLKISPDIIHFFITGLFEVTIGSKTVVDSMGMDLRTKIAIVSFIIGWSGFSIHAQVASIISNTDIKTSLYILSKILHGTFSSIIAYTFFPLFSRTMDLSIAVYHNYQSMNLHKRFLFNCRLSIELFLSGIVSLMIVSLFIGTLFKMQHYFSRKNIFATLLKKP
ncbi:sporulation integral membrane protein YlbJ [Alkaliphilus oremlandii]|uniref:Sporulation integral membrane protein YlbJ n=1 Tax=Alkaliphilus oremlandii (strain OhILAs) TaxID=350688 RepID=A8MHA2_ALKOO|nr:sporulation integral membrane protein YlbJ [Alkaliphilus oremlandii]ABW18989.1 Sporulation integral membrane protein YlbJ [Alkaliphilus oremlandii OhILAs]